MLIYFAQIKFTQTTARLYSSSSSSSSPTLQEVCGKGRIRIIFFAIHNDMLSIRVSTTDTLEAEHSVPLCFSLCSAYNCDFSLGWCAHDSEVEDVISLLRRGRQKITVELSKHFVHGFIELYFMVWQLFQAPATMPIPTICRFSKSCFISNAIDHLFTFSLPINIKCDRFR